jgi:hypothetical protein
MALKKTPPPYFRIEFDPMTVLIEDREEDKKRGTADSLYFRTERGVASIQYGGEIAGQAYNFIQMPSDPKFLRKLAKHLVALAKELDT